MLSLYTRTKQTCEKNSTRRVLAGPNALCARLQHRNKLYVYLFIHRKPNRTNQKFRGALPERNHRLKRRTIRVNLKIDAETQCAELFGFVTQLVYTVFNFGSGEEGKTRDEKKKKQKRMRRVTEKRR